MGKSTRISSLQREAARKVCVAAESRNAFDARTASLSTPTEVGIADLLLLRG